MLRVYFFEELSRTLLYLVGSISVISLTHALVEYLRSLTRHNDKKK